MSYKDTEPDSPYMDLSKAVGGRNRLARVLLTLGLAVVAIRSFGNGKRLKGALAGAGAVAVGYRTTTSPPNLTKNLDIGTTSEDAELHCTICGQPIRLGEPRKPDTNNEIVHVACAE